MPTETKRSKKSTEGRNLLCLDGHTYFAITRAFRTQCEVTTIARIPKLGKKDAAVLRVPRQNVSISRSDRVLRLGMPRH